MPVRFAAKEVEELPLRHHCYEGSSATDAAEVADHHLAPTDPKLGTGQPLMRAREERVTQAKLPQDVHRRRVHSVAAEIVQEVKVLFNYPHVEAGAGKQQPGHHAARTPSDDEEVRCCSAHFRTFLSALEVGALSPS
jgi:hypothetical protein